MSLTTRSAFYYIDAINGGNKYINFNEGGGELSAVLDIGEFTHEQLEQKVENAMNIAGADTYTVTFDRDRRKYTISSTGTFSLLLTSGSQIGSSAHSLLGFTGADTASAASHTSNTTSGSEFLPQFLLQDYVPSDHFQIPVESSLNTSAAGSVELITFGTQNFAKMSIIFQTDIEQPAGAKIENNPTGVSDFIDFLRFAVTKGPLEFMPDRGNRANFESMLLHKTTSNSDGVGFDIVHMHDRNAFGYYEMRDLQWLIVT